MEGWVDEGILLSAKPHGETAALAVLLTRGHGRHVGLVHGGQGSRQRPLLQPGNLLQASWKARLSDQLGHYALEMAKAHAAAVMDDPTRLAALSAACALVDAILPEREPHPALYDATSSLLRSLPTDFWGEVYVRWELGLLEEAGFGLDLSVCASTGQPPSGNDYLAYVSPRTGRAVSLTAGEPFKDKLLALPGFLVGQSAGGAREVAQGLALTGHFLDRHVFAQRHAEMPPARTRFVERYTRTHTTSGTNPA